LIRVLFKNVLLNQLIRNGEGKKERKRSVSSRRSNSRHYDKTNGRRSDSKNNGASKSIRNQRDDKEKSSTGENASWNS
jgi:hypothetical protein